MQKTAPQEDLAMAVSAVGCPQADIHASSPVRLYKCEESSREWNYTGTVGIATLSFNVDELLIMIHVTDLKSKSVVYSQELYEGFTFEKLSPYFYAFESDDHIAGLCFAEGYDAQAFYMKVVNILNLAKQQALMRKSGVATKSGSPATKKEKSGARFFGAISGLFSKKSTPEPAKPRVTIKSVKNFVKVAHVGFSQEEGFVTSNIPPEWMAIFKKAGVSEDDLKDKKTAKFLMKTIVAASETQGEGSSAAPPAPPPPNVSAFATNAPAPPPPPPVAMGKVAPPAPPAPPAPMGKAAPPPPLAPNAPAPPPPPAASAFGAESHGGDLMSMIKNAKLKKAEEAIKKINPMDEQQQNTLAASIAMAMASRREHMEAEDEEEDEDDFD